MNLFFDGVVSNGGLTKGGAGRLALNHANTFAGGATVTAGTLSFDNNSAAAPNARHQRRQRPGGHHDAHPRQRRDRRWRLRDHWHPEPEAQRLHEPGRCYPAGHVSAANPATFGGAVGSTGGGLTKAGTAY